MTSQVNKAKKKETMMSPTARCRAPRNFSRPYCLKLRAGLERLRVWVWADYEKRFPEEKHDPAQTIKEAEDAAWATPFPAWFFPPLAHLKVQERSARA